MVPLAGFPESKGSFPRKLRNTSKRFSVHFHSTSHEERKMMWEREKKKER